MVIAVVDAGGNLVAQQRMDDALMISIDISRNKAYTAVAVKMPTHELAAVSQSGQALFGIHTTDGGRIVIFGGGFPLKSGNEIIGGPRVVSRDHHASVVHQNVHRWKTLGYLCGEGVNRAGIRRITSDDLEGGRLLASGLELIGIPAGDDHRVPKRDELLRHRQTNPSATAGSQNRIAFKLHRTRPVLGDR